MTTRDSLTVLGISGSLRKASRNAAVLRAAMELAPEGMSIVPYDISMLPFYDGDTEDDEPQPVLDFKEAIADADGVLIVTPEYNYTMTGVLKNAIDWANRGAKGKRGPRYSAMALKPVFIMGASSTVAGSARAQTAVREAMIEPGALVYTQPQVLIGRAQDKVDENGDFVDPLGRDYITLAMEAFSSWIRLVGAKSDSPYRRHLEQLIVMDPRRTQGAR